MGLFFFAFTLERMTRTTAAPRNKDLIPGVPRFSRAAMYGKRGNRKDRQWKPIQAKNDKAIAEPTPVVKDFNGGKKPSFQKHQNGILLKIFLPDVLLLNQLKNNKNWEAILYLDQSSFFFLVISLEDVLFS